MTFKPATGKKRILIRIKPNGAVHYAGDDSMNPVMDKLAGSVEVKRATNVEFNPDTKYWEARACKDNELIARDRSREEVLKVEHEYVQQNLVKFE